jgi:hypothetical protein
MKKPLLIAALIISGVSVAYPSDLVLIDARIAGISAEIETQIERIKRVRENADVVMDLAMIRIEQQLRIAEQDLRLENEKLLRLREQLCDQIREADQAAVQIVGDWKLEMLMAYERIRSQIGYANDLITQLQAMVTTVAKKSSPGSSLDVSGVGSSDSSINTSDECSSRFSALWQGAAGSSTSYTLGAPTSAPEPQGSPFTNGTLPTSGNSSSTFTPLQLSPTLKPGG